MKNRPQTVRPRFAPMRLVLLSVCLAGAAAWCLPAGRAARQVQQAKTVKVHLTPAQLVADFVRMAGDSQTPYQFYHHYSAVFQQFAVRMLRGPSSSQAMRQRRVQLARRWHSLSLMAQQMGALVKLRQDIMDNNGVKIPFDQRQATFVNARVRHDQLLASFERMTGIGVSRQQSTTR